MQTRERFQGGVIPLSGAGELLGAGGGCWFIPDGVHNQKHPDASAVLPFDMGMVQGVQKDIEGSLGEPAPPSGDREGFVAPCDQPRPVEMNAR